MARKIHVCRCGHTFQEHETWDGIELGEPMLCRVPGCDCAGYDFDRAKSDDAEAKGDA